MIIHCDLIDQSTDSRDIELHEGSVNPGYIDSHGDGNIDTSRRNTGECETEVNNQAELTKLKKVWPVRLLEINIFFLFTSLKVY